MARYLAAIVPHAVLPRLIIGLLIISPVVHVSQVLYAVLYPLFIGPSQNSVLVHNWVTACVEQPFRWVTFASGLVLVSVLVIMRLRADRIRSTDVIVEGSVDDGAQSQGRQGLCRKDLRPEGRGGVDGRDQDGSKLRARREGLI